jgi:hypothetical protein
MKKITLFVFVALLLSVLAFSQSAQSDDLTKLKRKAILPESAVTVMGYQIRKDTCFIQVALNFKKDSIKYLVLQGGGAVVDTLEKTDFHFASSRIYLEKYHGKETNKVIYEGRKQELRGLNYYCQEWESEEGWQDDIAYLPITILQNSNGILKFSTSYLSKIFELIVTYDKYYQTLLKEFYKNGVLYNKMTFY